MAKLSVLKGATSVLIRIFIQDSTSTTGAGKTGLTNTSFTGTKVYVSRDDDGNAGGTSVSLTAATRGTWSSGGIVEKDATNMPGVYEFGLTNASIATGSRSCQYLFIGTGIVPCPVEIELTGVDNQDAVHGGMSALPNTAVTTNASLLTSGSGADQIHVDGAGNAYANVNKWLAGTIPAVNVTGVPIVDAKYLLGTVISTPATAGIMDVNIKNMNNVAATSITTINANQGTTQPLNFTGTGASALVKVDVTDWAATAVASTNTAGVPVVDSRSTSIRVNTAQAGAASTITLDSGASATNSLYNGLSVSIIGGTGAGQGARIITGYVGSTKVATVSPAWTTNPANDSVFALVPASADIETWLLGAIPAVNVTGVPLVDLKYTLGTISPAAAGYVAIDWAQITNKTATVALTNTTVGTVTTLTTLPSIPANWLTAAGINAGALNGKGDWLLASSYTAPPTTAAIATAIWTDTTAGDFTTLTSPGKIIFAQLGGAFTTTSSSVFTTASLANAPTGGGDPWATVIPGAYAAGTAGHRLGNVPDAAFPTNFTSLAITGTGQISEVVLCDTLTTYTSNTPQSGDSYARLGAPAGASVSADIATINGFLTPATSLTITFPMRSSTDGSLQPGKTVTATRITDGAAPTGCTNAVTENSGGDGKYSILLSATDLTFTSSVVFVFTASGCQETIMPFFTT